MYARGITPFQRQLLANLHFLSSSIPGTQDIRRQMGQHMRGATFIYGQPIFLTISPSERHSSLILQLSRFRTCDTLFQNMSSDEVKAQLRYAGCDYSWQTRFHVQSCKAHHERSWKFPRIHHIEEGIPHSWRRS